MYTCAISMSGSMHNLRAKVRSTNRDAYVRDTLSPFPLDTTFASLLASNHLALNSKSHTWKLHVLTHTIVGGGNYLDTIKCPIGYTLSSRTDDR